MKSRREVVSALLIDVAKAMLIAFVIGRVTNPGVITWTVVVLSIISSILIIFCACLIHPETEVDKGLKLWKP